ncbi:MAG TPA: hypothetical protein DCE42_08890 [Myxococcales bacterium]|nr:hypothetical protein [Deltaproteobacteria bacterium]HAA54862.1 hypothetical protein [Myxococcales bacterium]
MAIGYFFDLCRSIVIQKRASTAFRTKDQNDRKLIIYFSYFSNLYTIKMRSHAIFPHDPAFWPGFVLVSGFRS